MVQEGAKPIKYRPPVEKPSAVSLSSAASGSKLSQSPGQGRRGSSRLSSIVPLRLQVVSSATALKSFFQQSSAINDGSATPARRSSLLSPKRRLTSLGEKRIGVEMRLEREPETIVYDDEITDETLE
jgi:hypothetical protein